MKKWALIGLLLTGCNQVRTLVYGPQNNTVNVPSQTVVIPPPVVSRPQPPAFVVKVGPMTEIWVAMGQSNCDGEGQLADFPATINITQYDTQTGLTGEPRKGIGYGFAMQRNLAGHDVFLLQCSLGGTTVTEWTTGGSLLTPCEAMMRQLPFITGIIYSQGEQEASMMSPPLWNQLFTDMVRTVRHDFHKCLPVVYNQIGPDLTPPAPSYQLIHDEQAAVSLPNLFMARTDDIPHDGGGWHWDGPGIAQVVQRLEMVYTGGSI